MNEPVSRPALALRRRGLCTERRLLPSYLGTQPEVATGETTSLPFTISALTEEAPQVQGA